MVGFCLTCFNTALDIADSENPATWKFQNYIGWWGPPYAQDLQDMKKRVQYYKSFISSFCEPFRTAGLKLGDNDSIPIYPGQQWSPDMPWDNYGGRVTLAGDAAHSMVPRKLAYLLVKADSGMWAWFMCQKD